MFNSIINNNKKFNDSNKHILSYEFLHSKPISKEQQQKNTRNEEKMISASLKINSVYILSWKCKKYNCKSQTINRIDINEPCPISKWDK